MKIIYYDSTGQYLAVVAAAIHLNMLATAKVAPDWNDLKELPYFDGRQKVELGQIIFIGTDQLGNDIYILGSDGVGDVIEKAVHGINRIFDIHTESKFIDLTKKEDWLFRLGIKIKSLFTNSSLANRLIYKNILKSFTQIVEVVNDIRD
ncbi:DUF3189 family protein [Selenihalanaerobacter shriftii]|uniref:DUF3189 domain-containing protein n=1 Tax=Selenihalanaerobacter shriftii TaxID=142842 RepID=A0A1T4LIC3_9FIRM|nr:DUF3189 family protein [Selenihalanaerobacter shriftii]SJZ54328.1 Protein of unknown function [Selenihalanaerobacter shriftii]